jgi:ABC-type sugar transport system permease subunit
MTDTALGFVILTVGILFVLGVVFAISLRSTPPPGRPKPPRGVHMPTPSILPSVLALGAAVLAAGLAFKADDQLANPFLAIPGALILVAAIVAWVRAANHEWVETEHGPHDDGSAH